jgi:hypothetical protein
MPDLGLTGRRTIAFSVAGRAQNPRDFDTRRSEVWWTARQQLEKGLWDLDEDDDELAAQLMAPRWAPRMGFIHVETKEELAKRGISSPDRADAALIARLGEAMARRRVLTTPQNGHRPRGLTADLRNRAL